MRFLFFVFTVLLSFHLKAAQTMQGKITELDIAAELSGETLVFLSNGKIAKLAAPDARTLDEFKHAQDNSTWYEFTLNDKREILDYQVIPSPKKPSQQKNFFNYEDGPYIPSTLGSLVWAKKYFKEMRPNARKESECYNRAHVWAYDWKIKKNYYSSKVFVFFTKKYIRKYNFEWWFHVAPYVHVVENNQLVERVMDYKYSHGPLRIKDWTNIFMKDSAYCPVVKHYSQYANNPEYGSCFIMKESMYYYQPIDLENLEKFGTKKNFWMTWEVKNAYTDAFETTPLVE